MDSVDKTILDIIQRSFPIDAHPYRILGFEAGISEAEAWQRVENLRNGGIIRRIGGIFDSRNLGYVSTLCAAKVPQDKIKVMAEMSQGITEITHNYVRDHVYNMWFTVIASSQERLVQVLNQVRDVIGSTEAYSLPAIKIFKIGVIFDFKGKSVPYPGQRLLPGSKKSDHDLSGKYSQAYNLTEKDKALIRLLQTNLPHSLTPFADLAKELCLLEEEILSRIQNLLDLQVMRRLGAILYHYKAGFTSNAMGVWIVPEKRVDEVGKKMAEFREVSHCYQRPTLPDWPYNLFTMIHGHSNVECEQIMSRIAQATEIPDYQLLFSKTELKKSSMRYFTS